MKMREGEETEVHEDAWVLEKAGGISQVRVRTWNFDDGDWDEIKLEHVALLGEGHATVLLMRMENVRRCPGLGAELEAMERLNTTEAAVEAEGGRDAEPESVAGVEGEHAANNELNTEDNDSGAAEDACLPSTDEYADNELVDAKDVLSAAEALKKGGNNDLRSHEEKKNDRPFLVVCWDEVSYDMSRLEVG